MLNFVLLKKPAGKEKILWETKKTTQWGSWPVGRHRAWAAQALLEASWPMLVSKPALEKQGVLASLPGELMSNQPMLLKLMVNFLRTAQGSYAVPKCNPPTTAFEH